jgi:hypothetical protein
VLANLERAGLTISGAKLQFCIEGIKVVGYVCDIEGRKPATAKVIKILEWSKFPNERELRSFLGLVVYYRIWIKDFSRKAKCLYALLKNDVPFIFTKEHEEAVDMLKGAITSALALRPPDYTEGHGEIIVASDASRTAWGGQLC